MYAVLERLVNRTTNRFA